MAIRQYNADMSRSIAQKENKGLMARMDSWEYPLTINA
jgi:hypothetical protein